MPTVTYPLLGLHCNACVARVDSQLKPLAQSVAVTLDPMQVTLTNPSVDFTALQKAVADAGDFALVQKHAAAPDIPAQAAINTVANKASARSAAAGLASAATSAATFKIATMDCSVEESEIRRALEPLEGIRSLGFQLGARTLRINAPDDVVMLAVVAIEKAGFKPVPLGASGAPKSDSQGHAGDAGHDHEHDHGNAEGSFGSGSGIARLGAALVFAIVAEGISFAAPDTLVWKGVGIAVAAMAIWLAGFEVYSKGFTALFKGRLNINALMTVAVTGAFAIGQWPEAAMVMALYSIAELIEAKAVDRARNAIKSLMALAPETAHVLNDDGTWADRMTSQVALGQTVRVRPGERVPLDGLILKGSSALNQAPVTGESIPVDKAPGDPLFAGTINETAELEFTVTALANDSNVVQDAYGYLDEPSRIRTEQSPIVLSPRRSRNGNADYFVEVVRRWFLSNAQFGATEAERAELLYRGGLTITTTLDRRDQAQAVASIREVLSDPKHDPSAALVSIRPSDGAVTAYVGGRGFDGPESYAQFDLAGSSRRPSGSTFKPFVLAAALERHIPISRQYAAPSTLTLHPNGTVAWPVHNFEGEAFANLDLLDATVHSVNTVYAQLMLDVGPEYAVSVAQRLGVTTKLDGYACAVLGCNAISPVDVASAYATFAADGVHHDPRYVTKIVDRNQHVVYEAHSTAKRVIAASIARVVNHTLEQVVTRGTGVHARIGRPVAGKTGTTDDYRDAWFAGSTPELTSVVWVGSGATPTAMLPPRTRIKVTGGTWPTDIWARYMSSIMATVSTG